jgi:hypothetical protein
MRSKYYVAALAPGCPNKLTSFTDETLGQLFGPRSLEARTGKAQI